MLLYLAVCFLLLFQLLIQSLNLNKRGNRFFFYCSIFMLGALAALRSVNVGADTLQYVFGYEQVRNLQWDRLFNTPILSPAGWDYKWDYGYRLYNKIVSMLFWFSDSGQVITAVNSIILFVFLSAFLRHASPDSLLSIWLYLTLGFYQTALNMMPNAIASFLCLWAMKYVSDRKVIPWVTSIFVAAIFHTSAIFYLPIYWMHKVNLTRRKISIAYLAMGVVAIAYTSLIQIITPFIPNNYIMYINDRIKPEAIAVYFLQVSLYMICIACLRREGKWTLAMRLSPGIWCYLFTTLFYLLSLRSYGGMSRMAFLFSVYLIAYVPQMLSHLERKRSKKNIRAIIILITFVMYIARLLVNNIGTTIPYKFFF